MAKVDFASAQQTGMGYADIDPKDVHGKREQVRIVDVRQVDEFHGELGHIHGSTLIVLDTIPNRLNELPRNETIVFVCRSGGRSGRAAAFAASQGFESVYNMAGGMIAWNACGLEVEK